MDSRSFERLIARIHRVLEESDAEVSWNGHVPDPDNPAVPRQVDVLIDRKGVRTHVECRMRKRKQDVQWIEALFGRKVSLGADAVIGVSSSGFTSGAQRKATALGIFAREARTLTDDEIQNWGRTAVAEAKFVKFRTVGIHLVLPTTFAGELSSPPTIETPDGQCWNPITFIQKAAGQMQKGLIPEGPFRLPAKSLGLMANGIALRALVLEGNWYRKASHVNLPAIFAYRDSSVKGKPPLSVVQSLSEGAIEVHDTEKGTGVLVDVSAIREESAFLSEVLVSLGEKRTVFGCGCIGTHAISFPRLGFSLVREGSLEYYGLVRERPPEFMWWMYR